MQRHSLLNVLGHALRGNTGWGPAWRTAALRPSYDVVVISAGVNDPPGRCLEAIRARAHARRIIWILPAPVNSARAHVVEVACEHGDRTVSYVPGRDHLHPRSYSELARKVR